MADYYLSPVVNGETFEPLVKVGDTLEIGTEVYYDGAEVPEGWEQVDDPNDYSTTEQVIGTFLGKPLYRKIIKLTTTQNNDTKTYDLTSLSISEIKHIYGATHFAGYTRNLYNTYAANGTVTEFTGVYIGGNTLTFKSYNSNSGATFYGNVEIILEYTKTTD